MTHVLYSLNAVAGHLASRGWDCIVVGPLTHFEVLVASLSSTESAVESIGLYSEADRDELITLLRDRFRIVRVADTLTEAARLCAEYHLLN
jgi:hypothetical protein